MSREVPVAAVIPLAPKRAAGELGARSDDELMRLAGAGMMEAFGALVRGHERAVRAFCGRILGDRAHGDDAAQEVFLEIWRTCGRYEGQGRFRAFLFAAARNRCAKELRARRTVAELDERQQAAPGDQIDAFLAAERRERLDRLVRRLPPKLRDAIWLRFAAELEYGEMAEILARPEETLRSRVFHGLRRLRGLMGGGGDAGEERSRT